MFARMLRAALLEAGLYREVARDGGATLQALQVVALSSLAASIAGQAGVGFIWLQLHLSNGILFRLLNSMGRATPHFPAWALADLIDGVVGGVLIWLVWSSITWFIGNLFSLWRKGVGYGQMLRASGFAATPGVILTLGVVLWLLSQGRPLQDAAEEFVWLRFWLPIALVLATSLWTLLAMVTAVRVVMGDRTPLRAVAVVALSVPFLLISYLVLSFVAVVLV